MYLKFLIKIFIPICLILLFGTVNCKKQKTAVVTDINDVKEFKKLLRTKTNILVLYLNVPKSSQPIVDVVKETAELMKGQATLVVIDCTSSDSKKLCKKMKVLNQEPYYLKHYKDGEFHKDYDRSYSVNSMTNFLRDPTGDLPWEEDPKATDVVHLADGDALNKFLKKNAVGNKRSMIMFYAPWCGYCKMLKPDYVSAASDLKGEAILAAIDVSKPGNTKIRQIYNITGFPTLLYFEKGHLRFPYNGDNYKKEIVEFMKNPNVFKSQKMKQENSEWSINTDVVHLTEENFNSVLSKADHALVVFYAPWCGHCKRIKPELEKAATTIKKEKINGILAAVDATKQPDLASRFGVKGYPTLKYFNKGEYKYDAGHARQEEQIVNFIKNPQEPPPPPPPEKPWSEEESQVRHLDASSFRSTLRKIKHAIVMFYAPWCGHCKSTKPEFVKAAERFADELMVAFGAVDCTLEQDLCGKYDVKGYPTLKYFSYYDKQVLDYSGGRKENDFVSFIHTQMAAPSASKPKSTDLGFGPNVLVSTDDDFEQVIATPTPTFCMFYAVWCTHCIEAKPAFSRLATILKGEGWPVKIVAVEAADNPKVADLASITVLPTFKIFANGKFLANYEGERSTENMLQFCRSYIGKQEL